MNPKKGMFRGERRNMLGACSLGSLFAITEHAGQWASAVSCLAPASQKPLGDSSRSSDVGKETGVTLPSHLSVHLSVHPSSICSPDMTCVSNLSQIQPMDSAGSKHSADFPPPGALTSVTDSPTSPFNFAPPQVSDSQVPPSVKCGSDCLPVPRELSPP